MVLNHTCPLAFSIRYYECQKQWCGCSQRGPGSQISEVIAWGSGSNSWTSVRCELPWKWKVSGHLCSNDRTHVEDLKHPVEIRPPSGDRFLVALHVES